MPTAETVPDAEARIHKSENTYYTLDATERKDLEDDPFFHPLKDAWVKSLTFEKDPNEKALWCWRDCRERDRIRKLECDEIRRRVEKKLKDLGCPTQLIAVDMPSPCGEIEPSMTPAVVQQQPQYMPMPMPMYYGMPQQQQMG
jgi:hypothetical protein